MLILPGGMEVSVFGHMLCLYLVLIVILLAVSCVLFAIGFAVMLSGEDRPDLVEESLGLGARDTGGALLSTPKKKYQVNR